jgi:hypothetical protein
MVKNNLYTELYKHGICKLPYCTDIIPCIKNQQKDCTNCFRNKMQENNPYLSNN